jgi:hypothetical protein
VALDPGLVATLGREFLRLVRRGVDATAARARVAASMGTAVSAQALTYIITQARRATQIGLNIATLGPTQRLYDALIGGAPPAVSVGVNVIATIETGQGTTLVRPLYVRMQWHDEVQDVQPAVEAMVADIFGDKYNVVSVTYQFNGPTLWDVPSSYLPN